MSDPNFPGHQYFAQPGPAPVPMPPIDINDPLIRVRALMSLWTERGRAYSDDGDFEYADGVAHTYYDVVAALRDVIDGDPG